MSDHDVRFQVEFTHRLRQTDDVAGDDFDKFESVLKTDLELPARVQFWIDSNLGSGSFAGRFLSRLKASDRVDLVGDCHVIQGGEVCKNSPDPLRQLLRRINEHDMDRRSYVVVAGGGAVLDVAGYAAATAHRGIRLIRLPSTTLAQADSGVGVKNAINYFDKKNWLGTFAVPWAVINDVEILKTLPDRDFRSGLTESVKVALLKDAAFFDYLHENAESLGQRDPEVVRQAIARSCRLHLDHITLGGDPFESLEARPLDFGHWSAHRLEPLTQYELRHGEAVGIGVALDTLYSAKKFGLNEQHALRVCETFKRLGTPLWNERLADSDELLRGLEEFRQHLGGRLTITMLSDVGHPINVHEIDSEIMASCVDQLHQIASGSVV